MLDHVPSFQRLVHELSRLPGIGPKTAGRLAYFVLRQPEGYATDLAAAMRQIHEKIKECPNCFSLTEEEHLCHFCSDTLREDHVICVVEEPSDIARIESSGAYRGRYHVLHGAISPLDGVGPEDLKISDLMRKVNEGLKGDSPAIEEVILALDADLEGDTTVLYLAKMLKEKGVKITRIAHGVPIGGDIDYVDHRTLGRALENRVNV
tara:strand:- start:88067 stop:88687 length:621 start_codon:yes stop_codon:yes gene_type:complete